MKRTLVAVGVAVLVSMMLVPDLLWKGCTVCVVVGRHGFSNPLAGWEGPRFTPFFLAKGIAWRQFIVQTVFLSVLAAVIVNFPRRTKK